MIVEISKQIRENCDEEEKFLEIIKQNIIDRVADGTYNFVL